MDVSMSNSLPACLRRLEAESIDIMREAVAELRNSVMPYPIGKDSSVTLNVAEMMRATTASERQQRLIRRRRDRIDREEEARGVFLMSETAIAAGLPIPHPTH
jgi:3'-phosphoadenosine 5'-phosphosulfate sulfotransferase (PAPS reductase)/FAD synthetase